MCWPVSSPIPPLWTAIKHWSDHFQYLVFSFHEFLCWQSQIEVAVSHESLFFSNTCQDQGVSGIWYLFLRCWTHACLIVTVEECRRFLIMCLRSLLVVCSICTHCDVSLHFRLKTWFSSSTNTIASDRRVSNSSINMA
jgi:hypothetical protein